LGEQYNAAHRVMIDAVHELTDFEEPWLSKLNQEAHEGLRCARCQLGRLGAALVRDNRWYGVRLRVPRRPLHRPSSRRAGRVRVPGGTAR
jgi:hypothetical protein